MTGRLKWWMLLLLLPVCALAQPRVKGVLDPVTADGFHRIYITPELTAWARPDLSDLQLRDAGGQPVPYLLDTLSGHSRFSAVNYPLLSVRNDSARTWIELSVPEAGTAGFQIQFAATAARRGATLAGSNDRKEWYSIADNVSIEPKPNGSAGQAGQTLAFPFSRYPYLRLEIRNGTYPPLLPVNAGRLSASDEFALWNEPQTVAHSQVDSPGRSYVRLYNPKGILLERISVSVRKPLYYSRNVSVSALRNNKWVLLATQVLATGQRELQIPAIKDEMLELQIDNGDNPPLLVDKVWGTQRRYYLVAHLEKGTGYSLLAGDENARPAQYDLAMFRDRIPSAPPELKYRLEELPRASVAGKKGPGKLWIWIALAAGIGVLLWLTMGLMREMKSRT